MRRSRPHTVTGSLTVWGRLSRTQMCARRGRIGATDPRSGLCFSRTNDRGHDWVNRFPEARDPATCAGLTCANPAALATDRECQCRGGGFLSLTRDTRATMHVCMNIDTRVGPLGLPARTGVLIAHCPRRFAYFPAGALLYARRFRGGHVKPRARRRGRRQPPHRCDPFRLPGRPSRGQGRARRRCSAGRSHSLTQHLAGYGRCERVRCPRRRRVI